MLMIKLRKIS